MNFGLLAYDEFFDGQEEIVNAQYREEKQVSNIRTIVCNADAVLFPASGRKDKVVITLSGSEGVSKGAEYAATAAIQFPELSMVILKTPSWFYSEGMAAGKRPSGTSCWSYQGRELPFTPYKTRRFPIAREILRRREFNILEFNTGKAINPDSIIPVGKTKAPILLFSTKADTIWPSVESGQKIVERLEEHDFPYPYRHICFEYTSHMMLENCGSAIRWFIKSEKQFPEECAKERLMMGKECIRWIEQVWK